VTDDPLPGLGPAIRTIRIFCDGGSRGNPGPAAIGAVVLDATHEPPMRLATVSETIGVATSNVAEYTALIRALEAAADHGASRLEVRADSQLLIRQLEGRYRVKNAGLVPLHRRVTELLAPYTHVDLQHVRREENTDADALVNAALDAAGG
jgi:ribonuclease HI